MSSLPWNVALALLSVCCCGCKSDPTYSLSFDLSTDQPERELSYFPVAERNGELELPAAYRKTVDSSGYHSTTFDAKYPENLATPWRAYSLHEFDRVGIVILERDDSNQTIPSTAKVFWFSTSTVITPGATRLAIPPLDELVALDLSRLTTTAD